MTLNLCDVNNSHIYSLILTMCNNYFSWAGQKNIILEINYCILNFIHPQSPSPLDERHDYCMWHTVLNGYAKLFRKFIMHDKVMTWLIKLLHTYWPSLYYTILFWISVLIALFLAHICINGVFTPWQTPFLSLYESFEGIGGCCGLHLLCCFG